MADLRPVLDLPDGLPPWLAAFVLEAQRETDTLRDNGAERGNREVQAVLVEIHRRAGPTDCAQERCD